MTRARSLVLLAACGGGASTPLGERVGPLVAAAVTAADHERAPWRCAAPDGPALADGSLDVGVHAWKLAGHTLSRPVAGDVVIGVIADAGGASPATVAALGRLRGKLDGAHPTIVITLGGMGATEKELETALGVMADKADWPVVAIPGDLEPVTAHADAIAALRKRGAPIVDGRLARRIELGGATIATLPGTGAAARLPAGADGCTYRPADAADAIRELTDAKGIRVLAAFEAPRAHAADAAGEIAADQPFDIAVASSVASGVSAAASGGRDGKRVALSPGTSDATARLPVSGSTAGLLIVHDGSWAWKPI